MKPIPRLIALLLGISIPSLVLGRSVFAVLLGLAVILILFDKPFAQVWRQLVSVWSRPLGLCLLAVFVLSLPSLFASELPGRSFETLARTFVFCCLGVLIWGYLKERPELTPVWSRSLIIASALAAGFSFFSQYLYPEPYWFVHLKGWDSSLLEHALKGFSAITVLIVPVLALTCKQADNRYRWLALLTMISFILLVIVLENRATIAGLLALLACVAVGIGSRMGSKRQLGLATGLVLMCFTGTIVWLRITRDRMIGVAPDGDYFLPVWLIDFERQTIWQHALEIGMRTPWFGRGPNTINFAPGADKPLVGTQGLHVIPAHPHNWGVELFSEIGAIGLAVLLVFLIAASFRMLLDFRRSGDLRLLAAIAIFAGYWGSGLFNFSFWAAWWQLSFILALVFALAPLPKPETKPYG